MAEVFRARLRGVGGFERIYAVKRILPEIARDPQFVEMFLDEARIAARLNHPNIVQTVDLGVSGGEYFIAMEYVEGVDVRALFKRCQALGVPIPPRHVFRIVSEVCEGLSYAHNRRDAAGNRLDLVHRDVSPHNVMLTRGGEVKLIDFGVAKAAQRSARTRTGILKGKIAYMSPEQVMCRAVDHRADIFAAGVLLWELLVSERLFEGISDFAILEKIRASAHDRASARNPHVSKELDDIVEKALAVDPGARYGDAIELCDRLRAYADAAGEHSSALALATWAERVMSDEADAYEDEGPTELAPRRRRRERLAVGTTPSPVPTVRVSFDSEPAGALVFIVEDGSRRKIGTTPVTATLDRHTDCDVSIRKQGYWTWNDHLVPGTRRAIVVSAKLRPKGRTS